MRLIILLFCLTIIVVLMAFVPQRQYAAPLQYDIIIRNEAGETVYTWSANRTFIQMVRTVEINGEKNWAETIRAPAAGRYTATLKLAVSGRPYEVTVPFDVE